MSGILSAEVTLPSVFSDGMVLQRNSQVPIFGKAAPGEVVTVEFAGQKKSATVDSSNHWKIMLDPMPASSNPRKMRISETRNSKLETRNFFDVLVGEVWLCSGQSNMEMSMQPFPPWHKGTLNCQQEIEAATYPEIRFFYVEKLASRSPEFTCGGQWESCRPETAAEFPAVAYFFARQLYQELNVPIGVINSSWGSTAIESWMQEELFVGEFEMIQKHLQVEKQRRAPDPVTDFSLPSACYNGLIAPLIPYRIQGVIWCQGEANAAWPIVYQDLFPAMIQSWRKAWALPEMPFYFVQLANFDVSGQPGLTADNWARLRQAQFAALELPRTGMAVAADIGDPDNIHPRNKQEVGRRLALWALADTYGKNISCSGPLFQTLELRGREAVLHFDHTDGGLVVEGECLGGFIIAGGDRQFVSAEARVEGNTVVVWNSTVNRPQAVRYGWTDAPVCSLYNEALLPAAPFRTDSWEKGYSLPESPGDF